MPDATRLLAKLGEGDADAAARLLPIIEGELRSIARRHLQREPVDHTYQTTLLVDEAYMRLIGQRGVAWNGRAHFCALASRIIRRILVDHARHRQAACRGGGRDRLTLADVPGAPTTGGLDLLALEDALEKLGVLDERQARVVELRFFGGLTVDHAAAVLGVSPRTVEADWQMARAWLRRELE